MMIACLFLLPSCSKNPTEPGTQSQNNVSLDKAGLATVSASTSEHTILGNPSGAVASTSYPTNYLMEKTQYVLSYNNTRGGANWVAWHLNTSWLGSTARQDDFRADATLPSGWYQVGSTAYSGSGYDRGHQCPSADRTTSVANNSATFLMTNMLPQLPNLNQGPWEYLEDSCRALAKKGQELYIYSGGYGSAKTINSGHVTVPTYCWKIIVVLGKGQTSASYVTTSTRVIAVWMSNSSITKTSSWKNYRTTVDYIESMTGYDFLSNVSTSIQSVIESKVDSY
jgi:endonuclease G